MRAPPSSSDAANLFAASVIEDPQPFFSELRKERPLSRVGETGVHLVASWELIDEALGREDDFSANLRGVLVRGDDGLPEALELPYSGAADVIAQVVYGLLGLAFISARLFAFLFLFCLFNIRSCNASYLFWFL